ncbi:MAG: hypothetical protein WAW63_05460 [Candidatus Saccharimonadales bacterium]
MPSHAETIPTVQSLLARPEQGQVHFSDVFPEVAGSGTATWWKSTDFDAALTVASESQGISGVHTIPIGLRAWLAPYGLVLVDDLVAAQSKLAQKVHEEVILHPDALKRKQAAISMATLAVANFAPRDDEHTANNQNGEEFYLAITTSGLEVYAMRRFLGGLAERNRILGLYRIPTKGHPAFDGEHEQFRSARIVRTRWYPNHLEPVFQYPDQTALGVARLKGEVHDTIPRDPREGHIAFIDKFGNIKLEEKNIKRLDGLTAGESIRLIINNLGKSYEIPVSVARDLHSAPHGQLVVYQNCSDANSPGSSAGWVELVARVNENPSVSEETAIYQLLRKIPDLDPATAEVKLAA